MGFVTRTEVWMMEEVFGIAAKLGWLSERLGEVRKLMEGELDQERVEEVVAGLDRMEAELFVMVDELRLRFGL